MGKPASCAILRWLSSGLLQSNSGLTLPPLQFANHLAKSSPMKIDPPFLKSTVAAFAFVRCQLYFKLIYGLAVLVFSAGSAAAQTTPVKSLPIHGGSQPFAITMAEDGNFWFTLSNSSNIARVTPRGTLNYVRTPSLSNPAFITP